MNDDAIRPGQLRRHSRTGVVYWIIAVTPGSWEEMTEVFCQRIAGGRDQTIVMWDWWLESHVIQTEVIAG